MCSDSTQSRSVPFSNMARGAAAAGIFFSAAVGLLGFAGIAQAASGLSANPNAVPTISAPIAPPSSAVQHVAQAAAPVATQAAAAAAPAANAAAATAASVADSAAPVVDAASSAAGPVAAQASSTAAPVVHAASSAAAPVVLAADPVVNAAAPVVDAVVPVVHAVAPVVQATAPVVHTVVAVLGAAAPAVHPSLPALASSAPRTLPAVPPASGSPRIQSGAFGHGRRTTPFGGSRMAGAVRGFGARAGSAGLWSASSTRTAVVSARANERLPAFPHVGLLPGLGVAPRSAPLGSPPASSSAGGRWRYCLGSGGSARVLVVVCGRGCRPPHAGRR
jgi:hypothetical protein